MVNFGWSVKQVWIKVWRYVRKDFCFLDTSNKFHQWIFDGQIPRTKVIYDRSLNSKTSVLIIPDFDFEVDSGNYQCLTRNNYGLTVKTINVDKSTIEFNPIWRKKEAKKFFYQFSLVTIVFFSSTNDDPVMEIILLWCLFISKIL